MYFINQICVLWDKIQKNPKAEEVGKVDWLHDRECTRIGYEKLYKINLTPFLSPEKNYSVNKVSVVKSFRE